MPKLFKLTTRMALENALDIRLKRAKVLDAEIKELQNRLDNFDTVHPKVKKAKKK